MKARSLFSGIGGLDLAAEAAGIETAAFCEIEPFCVEILNKRWPDVPVLEDVRTIRGEDYAGAIDIIFGGFPCQDLSVAGAGAGLEGERSGLWFEMLRVIAEARPSFVLAENVRGAVNKALDTVRSGLEIENYEVWPFVVPASAFGAPHRRERLFVIGIRKDVADACKERLQRRGECGVCSAASEESDDELLEGCGRGALWPTPTVCGNYNRKGLSKTSGDGLSTAARSSHSEGDSDIKNVAVGQLNPDWVEQLMGFPEGWTNLDLDEPQPWRGWPAPMGLELYPTPCGIGNGSKGGDGELSHMVRNGTKQRLWKTPTVSNAVARTFYHNSRGELELSGQAQFTDLRLWGTPSASDCQGSHGGGQGKSLRTDISDVKHGTRADQYPYEFPRTVKGGKDRAARLKALGNAVVPQQAYPFFQAIAILGELTSQEES